MRTAATIARELSHDLARGVELCVQGAEQPDNAELMQELGNSLEVWNKQLIELQNSLNRSALEEALRKLNKPQFGAELAEATQSITEYSSRVGAAIQGQTAFRGLALVGLARAFFRTAVLIGQLGTVL